jgi:hypothetical protein
VAPAIPLFQVIVTVSPGLGSEEFTVKEIALPGQIVVSNTAVLFIPVEVGKKFGLQFFVRNCISRMTLPIKTPFLYSLARIEATPISPSTVGNMAMSPLNELIVTAGLEVSGCDAE